MLGITNQPKPRRLEGAEMTLDTQLFNPVVALVAGILILLMPRLLNYVVAFYLIAIGVIGLVPRLG